MGKTLKAIFPAQNAEGVKSSGGSTDGRAKLYKILHGIRACVRDTMFAYFLKATDSDSPLRLSAAISDDRVKERQGTKEN